MKGFLSVSESTSLSLPLVTGIIKYRWRRELDGWFAKGGVEINLIMEARLVWVILLNRDYIELIF